MAPPRLLRYFAPGCILPRLKAETKQDAIEELLQALDATGSVENLDQVRKDVFERENQMSTGLTEGLAIPHAKTAGVKELVMAVGLKPEGIDFESLDGQPARIVFLAVAGQEDTGPHLECLAEIAQIFSRPEARQRLIAARSADEVLAALEA